MVMDLKEIAGCILLVGVSVIAGELFPSEGMNVAWIGMAMMGASMASGIFQGIAGSGAASRRNQQAQEQYIQSELQKGIDNGREMFQATQQTIAQDKRNRAIMKNAYGFEYESKNRLKQDESFQQKQLGIAIQSALSSNTAATVASVGSSQGGTAKIMRKQNLINGLSNVSQIKNNFDRQKENVTKQFENMMSQQTLNLYLPNMQLMSQPPISESTTMPIIGGIMGGAAQGLGQLGGYMSGGSASGGGEGE